MGLVTFTVTILIRMILCHNTINAIVRTARFELKSLNSDYFFEYATEFVGYSSGHLKKFQCSVKCMDKVGRHPCLAAHYANTTGICSCGFVDYNNYVSTGSVIALQVNMECKRALANGGHNNSSSIRQILFSLFPPGPHVALLNSLGTATTTVLNPAGEECPNPQISTSRLQGSNKAAITLDYNNMIIYSCGGEPGQDTGAVGELYVCMKR